ncbi:cyclic nucleotide-binding/CBS domain-containing protein [Nitrosopumilus sp.]|uniref:CBS domain-containing protein n=1 Tax=Nitrosopumilus sp. TaxID=2024843 RepID=UPI003B5C0396
MTLVRDIMEKNVITADQQKTAHEGSIILRDKDISFLVIVKDDKPVGIVSERDIVRRLAAEDIKASSITLGDIMSKKFRWVKSDTTIEDAVQKMLNNNIRRIIVLDDEKLSGVVTQTNMTEYLRSKILINETMENIKSD